MRWNSKDLILLLAVAVLGFAAIRNQFRPTLVQAQSDVPPLYIEPLTTLIRKPDGTGQVQGKVFINLRTGEVWGYPTLSDAPYPVDPTRSEPPVSEPIYLGKFDLQGMRHK